ncbi:MAG: phosphotransferase [Pirellulaceae bacterium]|nr:phosphotransferase [Planctomycetales bacterium]
MNAEEQVVTSIALKHYGQAAGMERLSRFQNSVYRLHFPWGTRILKLAESPHQPAIRRELSLLQALEGSPVPVPPVDAADVEGKLCGRPYLVMQSVGQRTVFDAVQADPDDNGGGNDTWHEQMGQTLARIHQLDLHEHPQVVEELCTSRYTVAAYWQSVRGLAVRFGEEGVLPQDSVQCFLQHDLPSVEGHRLCHSDFSERQCIVNEHRIAAVVDWESSWLGNPHIDLAIAQTQLELSRSPEIVDQFVAAYHLTLACVADKITDRRLNVVRMGVIVILLDRFGAQGRAAWQYVERSGRLLRAQQLFTFYAQRL